MVGMSGAVGNYRCSDVNIVRRVPVHVWEDAMVIDVTAGVT